MSLDGFREPITASTNQKTARSDLIGQKVNSDQNALRSRYYSLSHTARGYRAAIPTVIIRRAGSDEKQESAREVPGQRRLSAPESNVSQSPDAGSLTLKYLTCPALAKVDDKEARTHDGFQEGSPKI